MIALILCLTAIALGAFVGGPVLGFAILVAGLVWTLSPD